MAPTRNSKEANFASQDFNLADYAAHSFGVFQEPAQDVVLQFSSAAAEDAADWVFHPSQTMEPQPDGSLIVRFRCGGMRELDWHLYTWGDEVEILAPAFLQRNVYKGSLRGEKRTET
jgi:predicted DNA-binding transcriptional regulator YafY